MGALVPCDTDVLIDLFNLNAKRHLNIVHQIDEIRKKGSVIISIITEIELLQGVSNKREFKIIQRNIKYFAKVTLHLQIAEKALLLIKRNKLRHDLTIPDAFVASTALLLEVPLFTYNVNDFRFIKGLELYSL